MPFNLPAPTAGAGAPDVEDGLAVVRFDDLTERTVEQFITESDKYGKPDDGRRLDFEVTLMELQKDGTYAEVYQDGDPVTLRQEKACKPGATGEKSNFRAYLSGILTAKELAAWEASTPEDPFDGSAVQGRLVNAKIGHNEKGWPHVETFISPVKVK